MQNALKGALVRLTDQSGRAHDFIISAMIVYENETYCVLSSKDEKDGMLVATVHEHDGVPCFHPLEDEETLEAVLGQYTTQMYS